MEEKHKLTKCWNCSNYSAYYTKGFCCFDKTEQGFCSKLCEIKEKHDSCVFWRQNVHLNGMRKAISKRALTDILINLSAIRQIWQEEQEEDKNGQK